MRTMKKWAGRLLIFTLCLCLLCGYGFALSEGTEEPAAMQDEEILEDPEAIATEAAGEDAVQYVAVATTTLKVRREPDANASGSGSIDQNALVSIIELGDEWSLVDTGRGTGYVYTKYLSDIREYSVSTAADASGKEAAAATTDATADTTADSEDGTDTSADTPDSFQEKFVAYAVKAVIVRSKMDEHSSGSFRVAKYEKVIVSAVRGDWCYIRYNNSYGYVPTSALFKWDRIDPYAGDIPGCTKHIGLAFVNHSTDIRSYDDNGKEVLKTVNPGSALAVDTMDAQGRYPLPYWRTTGYVEASDIGYMMEVVPWDEAESGDMISCMSTYYAVGIHTLQFQGRNWNIYLGSSFISGTVVQPGETVNTYDLMGPYRRSTGYHRAPVMRPGALSGFGGGTCQVNTTLYNVLIQVPIYINWRKVHMQIGIYYCPVGFDAAVGGGDITMIFTNTLPYAFRINYFMSDGCLTVALFRV
jgi:uncharacterized protein YgiM (DUF1202 family)